MNETLARKAARLDTALEALLDRLREDRTVLAVIRLGSGRADTVWNEDAVWLWVVVADGVRPRRRSDGDSPRIWRTVVENDVDLHCELIERAKFQRMVEGTDRSTTGWSAFSVRTLVHSADDGITRGFERANTPAPRDLRHDRLTVACWVVAAARRTRRRLDRQDAVREAVGDALELAWALAVLAILDGGEIVEHRTMERALELRPRLLETCYTDVLDRRDEASIRAAVAAARTAVDGRFDELMDPLLRFLDRCGSPVPLSELCEHFATSRLYPWQLSAACEWGVELGLLTKLSSPTPLTRKSRVRIDEPAYTRA